MIRRDLGWLALIAGLFLAWHLPLIYRTATGMDEDLFAVTGTTIRRTGLPQIPYIPTRDRRSFYYGADVALYILPPLSFYLEALVQTALGDGVGPARVASVLEGLVATWLVYDLARRWLGDHRGALWGALLYLYGRAACFPATTARPDMAATMFGLLSVWFLVRDGGERRVRGIVASGIAGGLSVLCHPMGLVPCAQVGLALLLIGPGTVRGRLKAAAIFTISALAALGTWGLLIARHPELFWIQFHGNVLGRAGPGLFGTLRNPWPVVSFQARQFVSRTLPVQALLYAAGTAWVLVRARRPGPERALAYHLGASFVLLVLFMGTHPMLFYFAYPAAFACIATGELAAWLAARAARWTRRPAAVTFAISLLLIASLIPGSGFRTILAHLRHWNDPSYDAHRFAARIMDDLEPDAVVAVDGRYVLDFYLAGRRVVDAYYLEFLPVDYDYLVVGPDGLRLSKVPLNDLELVRSYGDLADEFAPRATLYRPISKPREARP
jgi:hypothetical protein